MLFARGLIAMFADLRQMIENTRPFLVSLGKAKAAKLVRNLLDLCLTIEDEDGDIKV